MKCKRCKSTQMKKNGKREGKQCYLCKSCKHQFTSELGRHTEWEEKMAVSLYAVGLSFRTIASLFCVHNTTIYRWIRDYAKAHYQKPVPKGEIVVELDEMWHFIKLKKTNAGYGKRTAEQLDSLLTGNVATGAAKHYICY